MELLQAVERRVLDPFDLRNIHELANGVLIEYLAVSPKNRAELKCNHLREAFRDRPVNGNLLASGHNFKPFALKDDWNPAPGDDCVHLHSIERDNITLSTLDV